MKAKSVVGGILAAGAMVVLGQVGASANVVWCMFDPPATVTTPAGTSVNVNTTVYLPAGSSTLKNQVATSAVASADAAGGTRITVYVHVPATAHVVATVKQFKVSTQADGGPNLTLYLDIPIS